MTLCSTWCGSLHQCVFQETPKTTTCLKLRTMHVKSHILQATPRPICLFLMPLSRRRICSQAKRESSGLMGGLKVIGVRLGFPSFLNRQWAKQNSYVYIYIYTVEMDIIWSHWDSANLQNSKKKKDGYDELVSCKHPPGPYRSDLINDLSTLTLACQNQHAYTMHPFLRNLTQQFNQLQDAQVYRHYRPEVSFRCVGSLVPTKHGFTIMNRNNF